MSNPSDQHAEHADPGPLTPDQCLELFKFYEGAAESAKARAWSQTTWILALNAGVLGFSVNFYADHATSAGFRAIEVLAAGVGVTLCGFLIYLLGELGRHITHYWSTSNRIAAAAPALMRFVGTPKARAVPDGDALAAVPPFCRRLQCLAGLFALAHLGWSYLVLFVLAV